MPDKVPMGKPLPLSDAELDDMAKVTPDDIRKAKAFTRKHAPLIAELLDAIDEPDVPKTKVKK